MRRWLKRLLPGRISGQIALLLIVAMALTHITFTVANRLSRAAEQDAASTPARIGAFITVAHMLAANGDPASRQAIIDATHATYPALDLHQVTTAEDGRGVTSGAQADGPDGPTLDFIRRELGIAGAELTSVGAEGGVRLRLADGIEFGAVLPLGRMLPPFIGPIEVSVVFIAISLVLVFLWAARWVTAPLTAFARAARDFSPEGGNEPLPEVGPEEIQAASKALNRMRERIAGLVGDRTRMLAAVGHDLRTPITRLRLRAEFVEDEAMRRDMLRDLERMSTMVESALAYLKTGQPSEQMAPLDLPAVLQTIRDRFIDMGETVDYEGPDHLVAFGRLEDLVRAFENIIENGVKYGRRVRIRLWPAVDGVVATVIDDDGPGIAEDDRIRLAEPFVRGDAARSGGDKTGFGLGLSIASGICESHGGRIRLDDAPSGGLRVVVELPEAPDQA